MTDDARPQDATPPESALDFEKADFAGSTPVACVICSNPISDVWFDVNGKVACESCQGQLAGHFQPPGMDVKVRGLVFGLVAAAIGGAGWAIITQVTGYEIGLVAIAVGWLVGAAVARGTGRRGGWLMQLGAVTLTYLAVVSQYAYALWDAIGGEPDAAKVLSTLGIALAAPFLLGAKNILGIAIIGFGLWEAWKQSASVELTVTGPFRLGEKKPAVA